MKGCEPLAARFASIKLDIIALGLCRPEADDRLGVEPAFVHDSLQHLLRILKQLPRGFALSGILEQRGIAALQLPGLEEGRPVDIGHEFRNIISAEGARAREQGLGRLISRPVRAHGVGAGAGQRQT